MRSPTPAPATLPTAFALHTEPRLILVETLRVASLPAANILVTWLVLIARLARTRPFDAYDPPTMLAADTAAMPHLP